MARDCQAPGVVRMAQQVLVTIVFNVALHIPGGRRMAQWRDRRLWALNRGISRQGVIVTLKENDVLAKLDIDVRAGMTRVDVGITVQKEVASALEDMVGMHVRAVNVYIQDVA